MFQNYPDGMPTNYFAAFIEEKAHLAATQVFVAIFHTLICVLIPCYTLL